MARVAPVVWVPGDLCREGAQVQRDRHVSEPVRFGDHRGDARGDGRDASDAGDRRGCRQEVRDDHRGVPAQARVGGQLVQPGAPFAGRRNHHMRKPLVQVSIQDCAVCQSLGGDDAAETVGEQLRDNQSNLISK